MVDVQVTKFDVSSENGAMIVDNDRDLSEYWFQRFYFFNCESNYEQREHFLFLITVKC